MTPQTGDKATVDAFTGQLPSGAKVLAAHHGTK
jgi:hypothetical protein